MKKYLLLFSLASLIISCVSVKMDGSDVVKTVSSIGNIINSYENSIYGNWNILQVDSLQIKNSEINMLQNKKINIFCGCNNIISSYKIDQKNKIQFTEPLSTMKICNDSINKTERLIASKLIYINRYQYITDDKIKLQTSKENEFIIIQMINNNNK